MAAPATVNSESSPSAYHWPKAGKVGWTMQTCEPGDLPLSCVVRVPGGVIRWRESFCIAPLLQTVAVPPTTGSITGVFSRTFPPNLGE